jgi:ABC-type dipeptide/oligopeptide/nickel transport system permease subunit
MKTFWSSTTLTGKFGLFTVLLSIVVSVFAYQFIPDDTHNANNQIPDLALLPPMSTTTMLEFRGEGTTTLFGGYEGQIVNIPIQKISSLDSTALTYLDIKGNTQIYSNELLSKYTSVAQLENQAVVTRRFLFGTDRYGRDILSRLCLGIRISLIAGLIAVCISTVLGVMIGLVSGYFGGWVDGVVMFLINSLWAFPTILFVFAIVMAFGRSLSVIFIAVGCTLWIDVARLVRGQTLKLKEEVYIRAAKSYGASSPRILFRHILPNLLGPLTVMTAANFAIAILIEAGLSYLGFGVSPPIPSLGNILNENYGFALSGLTFMAVIPAIFIMILVLSFNFVSNSIRDYIED